MCIKPSSHCNNTMSQSGTKTSRETVSIKCIRTFGTMGLSGSSVGIATELRAGRSEIESRWGRDFPPVQTDPGAHPASCKMGTGSFPGVKCGRGVLLTTHPLLVPRSWKSRAIPLYPPSGPHRACNGITLPLPSEPDVYEYTHITPSSDSELS